MGRAYEVRKASIQKTGQARGKVYTTFAKEIYLVAKKGGVDPDSNTELNDKPISEENFEEINKTTPEENYEESADGAGAEGEEEDDEKKEEKVDYTNKMIVENVTYIPVPGIKKKKYKFLDKSFIFDLPESLLKMRDTKPRKEYEDAVETFAYNIISKITKFQVAHCQIFLGDFPEEKKEEEKGEALAI